MTPTPSPAGRNDALRQYAADGLRPQTLMFTVLGRHVMDRDAAVATSTFIDVLGRLDVSEQATRSTLTRMVDRGHLRRHRTGRRTYLSISADLLEVLRDGETRIFESPVRDLPEDAWTLLSFSIPEEQRSDRASLRAALDWNGFGTVRDGLWIAPGTIDVTSIVDRLGLHDRVEVFVGASARPTDMQRVVAEAWDLDAVRHGYDAFVERWSGNDQAPASRLAAHVRLITEWQQLLVADPGLSHQWVPEDWPASDAYGLFRRRQAELAGDATAEFEELLDAIPVPEPNPT